MEYSNEHKKSCIAGLVKIVAYVAVFAAVNAMPIAQISTLVYTIPLYAAILLTLWIPTVRKIHGVWILGILGGISLVSLLAIYVYYLMPHLNMINLGIATISNNFMPKVFFIISGIFALVTIIWKALQLYHSCKKV